MRGEGFEVGEGAAGSQAGFFEERRVQDEGAAVHEGVIGGFKGFARTGRDVCARDQCFIHLQVGLKFERDAHIPLLVPIESGEEFLTKGGGFLARHGLGSGAIVLGNAPGDEFQGTGGDGEQGFALEKIEEVAIEAGMDLQRVATVFDNIGVDEARDTTFAEDGFAELLSEGGGKVARRGFWFGLCGHAQIP